METKTIWRGGVEYREIRHANGRYERIRIRKLVPVRRS